VAQKDRVRLGITPTISSLRQSAQQMDWDDAKLEREEVVFESPRTNSKCR